MSTYCIKNIATSNNLIVLNISIFQYKSSQNEDEILNIKDINLLLKVLGDGLILKEGLCIYNILFI